MKRTSSTRATLAFTCLLLGQQLGLARTPQSCLFREPGLRLPCRNNLYVVHAISLNARDLERGYALWHALKIIKCKNVQRVAKDRTLYKNELERDSVALWSRTDCPLNAAILNQ